MARARTRCGSKLRRGCTALTPATIGHLRNALRSYVVDRDNKVAPADLAAHAETVRNTSHATVWAEMKRQHTKIGKLSELFAAAPEALAWP